MTSTNSSFSLDQLQRNVFDLLSNLSSEPSTSSENTLDNNARILLKQLTQIIEKRIDYLTKDIDQDQFEEEWVVLSWSILNVLARVPFEIETESSQSLNHLLVELVNHCRPVRDPKLHQEAAKIWPQFHRLFNDTLHLMHGLYSQLDIPNANFEAKLAAFCERQLQPCLEAYRQMCRHHAASMHTQLRIIQKDRMNEMSKVQDEDYHNVQRHYTSSLYILGILAARLQGFRYECNSQGYFMVQSDTLNRMMHQILVSYEQVLNDAMLSIEPSTSSILVTNNLFSFSCTTLSRTLIFKQFDVQIVGDDVAIAIQDEIKKVRVGQKPAYSPGQFPSAALLAMKPTSGVKRNNATANASGGGNTAHKKSDVNSKESVCLQPSYSEKIHAWHAQYPHLLCTTRQRDNLNDTRAGQIGKRPLFYFYTRAKTFSPTGGYFYVRTLSLPFTIATRRNQDCQVQRMMSSYTATCFWLYGTCTVDGLVLHWNDSPLSWTAFKKLCCQYYTVNAEVKRPIMITDFDLLENKMQCEDCDDFLTNTSGNNTIKSDEKHITFKNMLCAHLKFEVDAQPLKFSVWRGILEVLQIFQEQKSNAKTIWDDYLMHGFLDTNQVVNMLLPHTCCMVVRLTYILSGSICISYQTMANEIIHLEPIELKKLQTKSILEYMADIAESAKIDYILTARYDLMTISEMINKYKIGDEVKRVRAVVTNVSHFGDVNQSSKIKFTPLRVAVVACRETVAPPPTTPTAANVAEVFNNGRRTMAAPPQPPQVSFEVQLESLMKMYGKSANEVCDMFSFDPMAQRAPDVYPYLGNTTNYEYC